MTVDPSFPSFSWEARGRTPTLSYTLGYPFGPGMWYPALSRAGSRDAAEPSHQNFLLGLIIKTSKSATSTDFAEITLARAAPTVHRGLSIAPFARCLHEVLFWMTRNRIRLHPTRRHNVARQLRLAERS